MQAGLEILQEEGRSGLTVGAIANRMGVTEAAVFKHFDSKEEIIHGMAEKSFSMELLEPGEMEFSRPEELLKELFSSLFSRLEENPGITAMLFHDGDFSEYSGVRSLFQDHRVEKKERIERMVSLGQNSGFFHEDVDPERFASIVMGSIRMAVREWREDNFSHSLESQAEGLASHLATILEPERRARGL